MHKTAEIVVLGRVQWVGYRLFTKRYADHFHITGFVQNQADGSVKIVASGDEANITSFVEKLQEGPRMALVSGVEVTWRDNEQSFSNFAII
jgi:acylphosphatase